MEKPIIFVFCNACAKQWHSIVALAEDGTGLAGHLCSDHAYIGHDMGFTSAWKHDLYDKHYPGGWQLTYVDAEDIEVHARLREAVARNKQKQTLAAADAADAADAAEAADVRASKKEDG